jgi:PIN domain nuclease of toxin-antitoxin system
VNGYLLDTNIALIALTEPTRISRAIHKAVDRGPVYVSVISYWEVLLKSMKGKLDVGDVRAWWAEALDKLAARPLNLRSEHISGIYKLDPIHQDPFDRALIAQAIVEGLTLLTNDREIRRYASPRLAVIS